MATETLHARDGERTPDPVRPPGGPRATGNERVGLSGNDRETLRAEPGKPFNAWHSGMSPSLHLSGEVERAADAERTGLEDVGVDHRRAHVIVAEQLLDGADIVAGLEEVGREAMAQRVATGGLEDSAPRTAPPTARCKARSEAW